MNYSNRFFLYAPLGVFLALAFGVSVHWWIAASALSDRFAALNGREVAPGVTVHYASRSISGFPFSLDTVMQDVSFQIATPHGPTEWRTQHFAMHALTYGRDEAIFEAAGRQELRWTKDDGSKRDLIFAVGSLHASAIRDRGGLSRFDLDLVGFGSKALIAKRLQFHIRQDHDDKLDFVAIAVDVGAAGCAVLGGHALSARLAGAITQANAFSALRGGDQVWANAIANWRTKRGSVQIEELSLTPSAQSVGQLRNALEEIPADRLPGLANLFDALCGAPRH